MVPVTTEIYYFKKIKNEKHKPLSQNAMNVRLDLFGEPLIVTGLSNQDTKKIGQNSKIVKSGREFFSPKS